MKTIRKAFVCAALLCFNVDMIKNSIPSVLKLALIDFFGLTGAAELIPRVSNTGAQGDMFKVTQM